MCKNCILLGAMFNASEMDSFPICMLSQYDFSFTCETEFIDQGAAAYLKDTLVKFRKVGIDLVPIKVESDGSCLPHAVSRALMAAEIFYDCLRAAMYAELASNEKWYRANVPMLALLDDEGFTEQWAQLIRAAAPTRGQVVGSEKYLEGTHILALANALMRPILLLDAPEAMDAISPANIDGCGLYLPLRHSRTDILKAIGRPAPPVVIGWTSRAKDHYVALCCRAPVSTAALLGRTGNRNSQEMEQYAEAVMNGLSIPLLEHMQHTDINEIFLSHFTQFMDVHPNPRAVAAKEIIEILERVDRYLESLRDNNPVSAKECEKFLRIQESKTRFRHNLFRVRPAVALLETAGFCEVTTGTEGAVGVARLREFLYQINGRDVNSLLRRNRCIRETLQSFCDGGTCRNCKNPTQIAEVDKSAMMKTLFGPAPVLCDVLHPPADINIWDYVTKEYGDGTVAEGSCWLLGSGADGSAVTVEMKTRALESFNSLAKETEWATNFRQYWKTVGGGATDRLWKSLLGADAGKLSEDPRLVDVALYGDIATCVKCPVCSEFVRFTAIANQGIAALDRISIANTLDSDCDGMVADCPNCLYRGRRTVLSIRECFYVQMNNWLKHLFDNDVNALTKIAQLTNPGNSSAPCGAANASSGSSESSAAVSCAPCQDQSMRVHPRLWVCQQVRGNKACKVANLREKARCHGCGAVRTDLSNEELSHLLALETAAAPAELPNQVTGNNSTEVKTQSQIEEHEQVLAAAFEVLSDPAASSIDPYVLDDFTKTIETYSSYIEISRSGPLGQTQKLLGLFRVSTENLTARIKAELARFQRSSAASLPTRSAPEEAVNTDSEAVSTRYDSRPDTSRLSSILGPRSRFIDDEFEPDIFRPNSAGRVEPWDCPHCTYENTVNHNVCVMCDQNRADVPAWKMAVGPSEPAVVTSAPDIQQTTAEPLQANTNSTTQASEASETDADIPQRSYSEQTYPTNVRLYAVVKESSIIRPGQHGSLHINLAAVPSVDDMEMSPVAAAMTPQKMKRQTSTPCTVKEGRLANACVSLRMREERLMWDQVRTAMRADQ